MSAQPGSFRYVVLPTKGKGEDAINAELDALTAQGWEPISVTSTYPKATVGVLFRILG